eukprot:m.176950 g.176950  ORF g.176950 m.176950 type:complete len:979 (+) comp39152_c0_seq3:530-3466(+)
MEMQHNIANECENAYQGKTININNNFRNKLPHTKHGFTLSNTIFFTVVLGVGIIIGYAFGILRSSFHIEAINSMHQLGESHIPLNNTTGISSPEDKGPNIFIPVGRHCVNEWNSRDEMKNLTDHFKDMSQTLPQSRAVKVVYITGIIGSGKTTLANRYLHERKNENAFKAIITLKATDILSLVESVWSFFAELDIDITCSGCREWKYLRSLLPKWLKKVSPWLLLLDDFNNFDSEKWDHLPQPGDTRFGEGCLIVTTHAEPGIIAAAKLHARVLRLNNGMTLVDAVNTMKIVANDTSDSNDMMEKVARECDRRPLCLAAVSSYHWKKQKGNPRWTWKDTHSDKQLQQRASLPNFSADKKVCEPESLVRKDREGLRLLLVETLDDGSPIGKLLFMFELLDATKLSKTVIRNYLDEEADNAFYEASRFTFWQTDIDEYDGFIEIHKITLEVLSEVAKYEQKEKEMRELADVVVNVYRESYRKSYHKMKTKSKTILMNSIKLHVEVLLQNEKLLNPERQVWLHCALAQSCYLNGALSEAFSIFQRAIKLLRSKGQFSIERVSDQIHMITHAAWCARDLGRNLEARELFLEALRVVEGTNQTGTNNGLFRHYYGLYLKTIGQYRLALGQFLVSYSNLKVGFNEQILKEIVWDDVKEICSSIGYLGRKAVPRSVKCHIRALEKLKRHATDASWHIATLNVSLVRVQYLFQSEAPENSAESDERLRWALLKYSDLYGSNDRHVADVHVTKALVDLAHKRCESALPTLVEALEIYKKLHESPWRWRKWHGNAHFFKGYCLLQTSGNSNLRQVEIHFKQAYSIASRKNSSRDMSCAMTGLAKVYLLQAENEVKASVKEGRARAAMSLLYFVRQSPCHKDWFSLRRIHSKANELLGGIALTVLDATSEMKRISGDSSDDHDEMALVASDCEYNHLSLAAVSLYHRNKRNADLNWTWKTTRAKLRQQVFAKNVTNSGGIPTEEEEIFN